MLKATLISFMVLLAVTPALPAKQVTRPVTIAQLSAIITTSRKERDGKLADHLYKLQLTQRLSAHKSTALKAKLPGHKSRQALLVLSERSQFLPPPPAEIPNRPAPSIPLQQDIINRSIAYVVATIHRLPNLYARIHTMRYRNTPPVMLADAKTGSTMQYGIKHKIDRSVATVLYRDGREVIQKGSKEKDRITPSTSFMATYGEFGPIFTVIFGDLPNGKLKWARWTQTPDGMDAVFRFTVPRAASHYMVGTCCVHGRPFKETSGYHGELTIDPSTGTILRLAIITDAPPYAPLAHWGMMVQYGPVTLGGKKYFCPVKSVSVFRGPAVSSAPKIYKHLGIKKSAKSTADVPMQTQLNQTTYSHYHLFRANVKILPYKKNSFAKPTKPEDPHAASGPQSQPQHLR